MAAPMLRKILSSNCYKNLFCVNLSHEKRRWTSSSSKTSHAEYCMDLVRKFDFESYLGALLLPSAARSSTFALKAFNVEVAQIRDRVSDRNIGYMRMQFWKDAIDGIYKDKPPHSPVGMELYKAVNRHKLSKRWLKRIIEGREENLADQQFASLKAMEDYAEQTVSTMYYLILEILGIKNVQIDHVASHIGKAQCLATQLRATPFNASQRRVYLPLEIMLLHGVSQEDIVRRSQEQTVKSVIYDIAGNAHQHLEKAVSMKSDLTKESKVAFLQTASIRSYLTALQRADFNVFDAKLQQRNHMLPLQMWLQKIRGTL